MPESPESILSISVMVIGVITAIGLVALTGYAAFFQKH